MRVFRIAALAALILIVVAGCAKRTVTRIDTDTTVDLSGRWNDTDSRLVSDEMIRDCLNHPWLSQHMTARSGKRPVVIVGVVRNKTTEHIPVGTFINDLERAFIDAGSVEVVAGAVERSDVRDERDEQQRFASEETAKAFGREHGADYMLAGEINSITDQEGGRKVLFYQVDLTLINMETNTKVWLGQKKIKKFVGQGKYSP
jgi:penicillin-binding protein activator